MYHLIIYQLYITEEKVKCDFSKVEDPRPENECLYYIYIYYHYLGYFRDGH